MKTRAFLIRAALCFLLSLIPATDLEHLIYDARMSFRGHWGQATDIVLVQSDTGELGDRARAHYLVSQVETRGAALALVDTAGLLDKPGDLVTDSDGVIRRALLIGRTGQGPSLALRVYQRGHVDAPIPQGYPDPARPHLINYVGPQGSFPHCSVRELLETTLCPDLAGKIVILADTSDPQLLRTPLGQMLRPEILANDVNTVVRQHPVREVGFAARALITIALILLTALYIVTYPVLLSALAVAGTGFTVVVVLFQVLFQLFHVYVPSLNIGGSMLITYLVFTGFRMAFQENLQWRSLKQAQYLRELEQMKSNFLSLVSHDLKTPLAKIQAVTERLRRELALPPSERSDWKELLDSIENSNQELKHYITSILNLSKIESQKVILRKRSVDINELIQRTLRRLRPLAVGRGLVIEEQLEPLFSVECDEDLMLQVLTNLIDNAIKYSPRDSRVIVSSREEGRGHVRIDVQDFGPGIPTDQLPLMFRKFSRFARPRAQAAIREVKGSGLGLYLSKYFIEMHGGWIRVKSVEGQGTVFSVTLPVEQATPGLRVASETAELIETGTLP